MAKATHTSTAVTPLVLATGLRSRARTVGLHRGARREDAALASPWATHKIRGHETANKPEPQWGRHFLKGAVLTRIAHHKWPACGQVLIGQRPAPLQGAGRHPCGCNREDDTETRCFGWDPGQGPTSMSSTHTTLLRLTRYKALARKKKATLGDSVTRGTSTRVQTPVRWR